MTLVGQHRVRTKGLCGWFAERGRWSWIGNHRPYGVHARLELGRFRAWQATLTASAWLAAKTPVPWLVGAFWRRYGAAAAGAAAILTACAL
jgi:hypothetical protein